MLFLVAALMLPGLAEASEFTTEDLFALCSSDEQNAKTLCGSYILGAVQGSSFVDGSVMSPGGDFTERPRTIFCLPDGTTQNQMVASYKTLMKAVLEKFPRNQKLPAVTGVIVVMANSYPCSKPKS